MKCLLLRIVSIMLTLMMSTTLLFAKSTEMDAYNDINEAIDSMSEVSGHENIQSKNNKSRVLRLLDKQIKRAEGQNLSLENEIAGLEQKLDKAFLKTKKHSLHILSSQKQLERLLKKAQEKDGAITMQDLQEKFRAMGDINEFNKIKQSTFESIKAAGSYAAYLRTLKEQIKNDEHLTSAKRGSSISRSIANSAMGEILNVVLIILVILGVVVLVSTLVGAALGGWIVGLAIGVVVLAVGVVVVKAAVN